MQLHLPDYLVYLLTCVTALAISLFSIPNIIYVSKRKRLLDMPDNERKLHKRIVPNLGGVGIFIAFVIATSLYIKPNEFGRWTYINAALLILFVTGIKDDLVQISPTKKFLAQIAAALITVCLADIRISNLHGIFGIYELPQWLSIGFTVVGCVFVTNAFNLIDGIDGLAGTIGVFISLIFGIALAIEGKTSEAIVAFSLVGAILGFLRYNISPASIFMGDTGSLIIGFSIAVLSITFVNAYHVGIAIHRFIPTSSGALVLALAVLFIPVFDTFRVFTMRIIKGRSPFSPDRTHLHHYLLDLGLTHSQTVSLLLVANTLIVAVVLAAQRYNVNAAIISLLLVTFGLFGILMVLRRSRREITVQTNSGSLVTITGEGQLAKELNGLKHQSNNITVNGKKIVISEPEEAVTA
jgi:UDP-GlcNAc:undecaprenyl-phosphate GlcNAc-1-phosphate transferase